MLGVEMRQDAAQSRPNDDLPEQPFYDVKKISLLEYSWDSGSSQFPDDSHHQYLVEFQGPVDPSHPQNWSIRKKFVLRVLVRLDTVEG